MWGRGTLALAIALVSLLGPGCGGKPGHVLWPDADDSGFPSDTGFGSPRPFWGSIDCDSDGDPPAESGEMAELSGGDPNPRADGRSQGDDDFRRLRVFDGDDFYGERCELGYNNQGGPTVFYREGEHRITYLSLRLPAEFPLGAQTWQVVTQMKQTQPSRDGGTPIIELDAADGAWILRQSGSNGPTSAVNELWRTPAQTEVWTRFAFDVLYSQDSGLGEIQLSVDANGDGDFDDAGERSPRFHTYTLKFEPSDDDPVALEAPRGALQPGESIPSHLRAGIYHDPKVACPPPDGCWIDLDNVQVVEP